MLIWRNRMMPRSRHNDQPCEIIRELDRSEVDADVGPMFEVHFPDTGEAGHAFGDELIVPLAPRKTFASFTRTNNPPPPVLNSHVAKAIGRTTELSEHHVYAIADRQDRTTRLIDFVLLCRQDMDRR